MVELVRPEHIESVDLFISFYRRYSMGKMSVGHKHYF